MSLTPAICVNILSQILYFTRYLLDASSPPHHLHRTNVPNPIFSVIHSINPHLRLHAKNEKSPANAPKSN